MNEGRALNVGYGGMCSTWRQSSFPCASMQTCRNAITGDRIRRGVGAISHAEPEVFNERDYGWKPRLCEGARL
jgi:hypothetical protein